MTRELKKFYKGKRVFLTGHTGFKGSWMVHLLEQLGADVFGYALPPKPWHKLFNMAMVGESCHSLFAEILNVDQLNDALELAQPDVVLHLAAQPLVKASYDEPLYTFQVNTMGTANLLDQLRKINRHCAVVVVTTDKVYENKEWWYPYREADELGGHDPYAASKAAAELVVASYRNSFL